MQPFIKKSTRSSHPAKKGGVCSGLMLSGALGTANVSKNKVVLRLHKDLYRKEILERVKKEDPKSVVSLAIQGDYYLLDLCIDGFSDCLDFLNYLIYINRIE
jgi:hypothetical protein